MLMGDEVPPRENLLRKTLFTQILMPNWAYKNQPTNQMIAAHENPQERRWRCSPFAAVCRHTPRF
jgi:hypothetical protein